MASNDDGEPAAWRLYSGYSDNDRPLHDSLDCNRIADPSHYRPVNDPGREDARWCKTCRGPYECHVCDLEFDTLEEMKGHCGSHGSDRDDTLRLTLMREDFGPEDVGLSPIGEREVGD